MQTSTSACRSGDHLSEPSDQTLRSPGGTRFRPSLAGFGGSLGRAGGKIYNAEGSANRMRKNTDDCRFWRIGEGSLRLPLPRDAPGPQIVIETSKFSIPYAPNLLMATTCGGSKRGYNGSKWGYKTPKSGNK